MQLAVEVSFEIYFGEINFPKNHSKIFLMELSENFFFGKFRKIMIGIGLKKEVLKTF